MVDRGALTAVAELAGRGALTEDWSPAAREAALKARKLKKGDWVRNTARFASNDPKPIKGFSDRYEGQVELGSTRTRAAIADLEPVPKPSVKKVPAVRAADPSRSISGEHGRHQVTVEGKHVADAVEFHRFHGETGGGRTLIGHSRSKEWHVTEPGAQADSFKGRTRVSGAYTREDAVGEVLKRHLAS